MRRQYLISLLLAALPATAAAQQNLDRAGTSGFAVEAIRPTIKDFEAQGIGHAAYFVSAHYQVSSATKLVVELPIATGPSYKNYLEDAMDAAVFGAPYLGARIERGNSTFDVGLRAPLGSDVGTGTAIGFYADIERLEAFMPDLMMLRAGWAYQSTPKQGMTYGVQLAPNFWVPTKGEENDNELFMNYGANIGYRGSAARVTGRFSGRAILTESDIDFAERTIDQLALSGDFGAGRVRPGFYAALPLDKDYRDAVSGIFGLTLQVSVGK